MDSAEEVTSRSEHAYPSESPLAGGAMVAGVSRAEGAKCQRCWNYSTAVGSDGAHPSLCERCSPVIRDMGFQLPSVEPAVAA